MKNTILIFLLLVIFVLLIHRNQSNYPASSTATQRIASFIGYTAAAAIPWRDLDRSASGYTGCVAAGGTVGTGWNNVSLATLNDYAWNGIPGTSSLTPPAGVTFGAGTNIWGFRKEFVTNSDGSAGGGGLVYFLTGGDPTSKLTVTPTVAGFYVASDGTRYSIPNAACLQKSVYDPQAPVNCVYTPSPATCSATTCGTYGTNQFTISALTPATHDGTCLYGTTPVTGVGQTLSVSPTSPCQAPACGWATLQAVTDFGFGPQMCDPTWETLANGVCTPKGFKLSCMVGTTLWYLYWDTATSAFAVSTVDNNSYYKYDATAKTLSHYSSGGILLGTLWSTISGNTGTVTLIAPTTGTYSNQWAPAFNSASSKWLFKVDNNNAFVLWLSNPYLYRLATSAPFAQVLFSPVFI